MSLTRADVEDLWERLDKQALDAKFSQEAIIRLTDFYRGLDDADRVVVDQAVADWVVSDDSRRRFDARALIREFQICSALPALQERLETLPTDVGGPTAAERADLVRLSEAIS